MTREEFAAKVGRPPIQDDLERVNCADAGYPSHLQCGWCHAHNGPIYMCPEMRCNAQALRSREGN